MTFSVSDQDVKLRLCEHGEDSFGLLHALKLVLVNVTDYLCWYQHAALIYGPIPHPAQNKKWFLLQFIT